MVFVDIIREQFVQMPVPEDDDVNRRDRSIQRWSARLSPTETIFGETMTNQPRRIAGNFLSCRAPVKLSGNLAGSSGRNLLLIALMLSFGRPILADGLACEGSEKVRGVGLGDRFEMATVEPDKIEFDSSHVSARESDGHVSLRVFRIAGRPDENVIGSGVVAVDFSTSDGTARSGVDYKGVSGTLFWADDDFEPKTFDIPLFDNDLEDGNKTVNLRLSNPVDAVLGRSSATLTILDDETLDCVAGANTLCLGEGGRFKLEVAFADFAGNSGAGVSFDISPRDSGLFFFFDANNIEMLVKVLDACGTEFDSYWVFFAATTNVEFTLMITDVQAGVLKIYENALGNPAAPVLDTGAFETCP